MAAWIRILRPLNCAMAAVGVLVGVIVAAGARLAGTDPVSGIPLAAPAALASGAAFLVTGAGNVLNDYFDRKVDQVNHPDRPIPSGEISPGFALQYAQSLFVGGIVLAVGADLLGGSTLLVVIAIVNAILLVGYERNWKSRGTSGNVVVAWLSASVFLYGGAAVDLALRVVVLVLLAFLVSLGREIVKDVQDLAGDRAERSTLPMAIGAERASAVAGWMFVGAVVLSILPAYPLGTFAPVPYLPLVVVADAMFISAVPVALRRPERASQLAKAGMFMGLVAFLAGGIRGT